jgi:hypothetical protein
MLRRAPQLQVESVDVSKTPGITGLTAVPTVVTPEGSALVGTQAFEWLQEVGSSMATLDGCVMALGVDMDKMPYIDFNNDTAVHHTPFSAFT